MDVELDQFVMDDTNNIYDSEDVAAFEATLDPTLVREVKSACSMPSRTKIPMQYSTPYRLAST